VTNRPVLNLEEKLVKLNNFPRRLQTGQLLNAKFKGTFHLLFFIGGWGDVADNGGVSGGDFGGWKCWAILCSIFGLQIVFIAS
jgi:hypothetical protein